MVKTAPKSDTFQAVAYIRMHYSTRKLIFSRMSTSLQCFRPLLRTRLRSPNPKTSIAYLRFYSATEAFASKEIAELDQSSKLTDAKIELYPRLRHHDGIEEFRAAHFLKTFQQLTNGDTLEERDVSVNGRF